MKTPCGKFTVVNGLLVTMKKYKAIKHFVELLYMDGPNEVINDKFCSDLFIVPSI